MLVLLLLLLSCCTSAHTIAKTSLRRQQSLQSDSQEFIKKGCGWPRFKGYRKKLCEELMRKERGFRFFSAGKVKGRNRYWCKYKGERGKTVRLDLTIELALPKNLRAYTKELNSMIENGLKRYIGGQPIYDGYRTAVNVRIININENIGTKVLSLTKKYLSKHIPIFGKKLFGTMTIHGFNSKTILGRLQKLIPGASGRSFNIEFLTGAGIWSYLDESKVKSAIKEENISPGSSDLAHVFAHEVGHSVIATYHGKLWSMTHKKTSTITQKSKGLPNRDNDIMKYPMGTAFKQKDLEFLVLSC